THLSNSLFERSSLSIIIKRQRELSNFPDSAQSDYSPQRQCGSLDEQRFPTIVDTLKTRFIPRNR
ncbi:unnamed protein product, partial [Ilex paraguariensis]